MQNLEDFIDQLITDRQLPDITDDVRNELKADLTKRLMEQIDRATLNALSEEQADELSKKMDDPDFSQADLDKFMEESGVNMQKIALEAMLKFRSLYLGARMA